MIGDNTDHLQKLKFVDKDALLKTTKRYLKFLTKDRLSAKTED